MPIITKNGIVQNAINPNEILENNIDINEAFAKLHNAQCIGILFPSHSDGRGFSIAKTLRRNGFMGKLRAIGPLIPDQFADLIACGFDEIEISEEQLKRQSIEDWLFSLKIYNLSYQNNNGEKTSILAKRGE